MLSLYEQNLYGVRDRGIEHALKDQLSKHVQKHQSALVLADMGIPDGAGAVLINCLLGYSPLTSLDLSG